MKVTKINKNRKITKSTKTAKLGIQIQVALLYWVPGHQTRTAGFLFLGYFIIAYVV